MAILLRFYSTSLFFSPLPLHKTFGVLLYNSILCSHLPLLFGYAVLSSTSSLTSLSHKTFSHFDFPCLTLSLIHSLVMNVALSPVSVLCERISIAVTKSSASTPTHSQKPVYTHPTSKSNTST